MIYYREIIRLKSANYSNTSVASSTGSSRDKVVDIWNRAQDKQIEWPIPDTLSNEDLKAILYSTEAVNQSRLLPRLRVYLQEATFYPTLVVLIMITQPFRNLPESCTMAETLLTLRNIYHPSESFEKVSLVKSIKLSGYK